MTTSMRSRLQLRKERTQGPRLSSHRCCILHVAGVRLQARTAVAQDSDLDPRIVKLVATISEERLGVILKKLESFETRSTLSSTDLDRRAASARRGSGFSTR